MSVPTALPVELFDLDFVHADLAAREQVRSDRSGAVGELPVAVARPTSVEEVQQLLWAAHRSGTPVVPRGAGTGLAGGALGRADAVVCDLSGLRRIHRIDPVNRLAHVEPGVITADLDRAAARHGLRYSPDPASAAISTIGGNIATNAGGLRCLKYGVTRNAVRALDVVLADGSLLATGGTTTKSVTGYDLTSLFVGSEGTLGIVVGATLALDPVPTCTATLSAGFATAAEAAGAVARTIAAGIRPAAAELLDRATLDAIDAHLGTELGVGGARLIVQTEGLAAAEEIRVVERIISETALDVVVAADEQEASVLLAARRAALPAIERLGTLLIEDICVPVSRLAEAVERVRRIGERHGVPIFTLAHAGDGNLHPILLGEHDDPRVAAAAAMIFALALDLGGTVTGEHGIGALKTRWAAHELGATGLRVHRAIRQALDPDGILNPGRAF